MATRPEHPEPLLRTYQLLIVVAESLRITIGRLGTFDFPAGNYVYTGSAMRNFEARIRRHQSRTKKKHWHIDYLLDTSEVVLLGVRRLTESECAANQQIAGEVVVRGFGSTDCCAGCASHLKRVVSFPVLSRCRC